MLQDLTITSLKDFILCCIKYRSIIDGYNVHAYNFRQYDEWLSAREKKDNAIIKYLYHRYFRYFDALKTHVRANQNEGCPEKVIWQFWWQGSSDMPQIVKACVNSVRAENPDLRHVLITEKNFEKFVDIPAYIIDKLHMGKISVTHFSDILRMLLLSQQGGIWLDATVFCSGSLNKSFGSSAFYTCKTLGKRSECVADYYWTCYAMSSCKNHIIPSYMSELLLEYWKNEDGLLDYFLVDYCMKLLYIYVEPIKKVLDDVPENNTSRNKLVNILNTAFNSETYEQLTGESNIFKLTWKETYPFVDNAGNFTFYHYILKRYSKSEYLGG